LYFETGAVHGCPGRAEPASGLLRREPAGERNQYVRDVGVVAAQDASGGAAPDSSHDEFPDGGAGPQLGWPGIEVGEGAREHHIRQHRVGPHEFAEYLDHADQIAPRIAGIRKPAKVSAQ